MEILAKTTVKINGRYETGLLWIKDDVELPESQSMAVQRLRCTERKMDKDADFAKQYCEKIADYERKNYIRKLNSEEYNAANTKTWYLPHFGVINPSKPGKIRLVFDAAAKSHGVCLTNDNLLNGPDLVTSIISVLIKFRQGKFAICGDIKEMFHQMSIRQDDRCSQRFLWRGMQRNIEPDVYKMNVMIFGSSSSPCSAQFVKNLNAQ